MEELIRKPALLWCRGESPSVPAEVIRQLAESAEYVLSACGGGLMAEDVEKALETGLKTVRKKVLSVRFRQQKVLRSLFFSPNVYWKMTVKNGTDAFRTHYDPLFAAHETVITADYPLYRGRPEGKGVTFIESYLIGFEAENDVLRAFSPEKVHRVMPGVSPDYRSARQSVRARDPVSGGTGPCRKALRRAGSDKRGHKPPRIPSERARNVPKWTRNVPKGAGNGDRKHPHDPRRRPRPRSASPWAIP